MAGMEVADPPGTATVRRVAIETVVAKAWVVVGVKIVALPSRIALVLVVAV